MDKAHQLAAAAIADVRDLGTSTGSDRLDHAIALAAIVEIRDGRFQDAEALIDTLSSSTSGNELASALSSWLMLARDDSPELLAPARPSAAFDVISKERHVSLVPVEHAWIDDLPSRPAGPYARHPSELVLHHLRSAPIDEGNRDDGTLELTGREHAASPAFPYDLLLDTSRELVAAETLGDEADAQTRIASLTAIRRALLDESTTVIVHAVSISERGNESRLRDQSPAWPEGRHRDQEF